MTRYILRGLLQTVPVLFGHILPNNVSPLLVFSSMQVATAILPAAILSFLGLGVQAPTPSGARWSAIGAPI